MRPVIGITCGATGSDTSSPEISIGANYISAVENAGGTPIVLPLTRNPSCLEDFLNMIDGLLLSGGVDPDPLFYGEEPHPALGRIDVDRDYVEMQLTTKALKIGVPILGICRGIQMLNISAGGTLYQDIHANFSNILKHRQSAPGSYGTHTIDIREGSRLLEILGQPRIRVNSFHHQAVKKVAENFMVSALACDGVIEGIESTCHDFAIGVQFHPELMWQSDPSMMALFSAFVNTARVYGQKRNQSS